jgi:hypothetical protein
MCLFQRIKREQRGRKLEGVGVMKDKEVKCEEMEVSHTQGGAEGCRVQWRGKWRVCRCYSDVRDN